MRVVYAILLLATWALPMQAQQSKPEPLVVPFARFPPFLFFDENGLRSGFMVDLAQIIGTEIGVAIDYLDVLNAREWVAAQAAGRTHMIPGVLELPPLAANNVFSGEVAADVLRLAVLASGQEVRAEDDFTGLRIGAVPQAVGSDEPILAQNDAIDYITLQEALVDLLSGRINAVLIPTPSIYGLARDAGVEGRIGFIGAPLHRDARHVSLHESWAALLGPINEAIARIEAEGRLEELRRRYNISVPLPTPDVLRIGLTHLSPLSISSETGGPTGFAVEVVEAVVARAGLELEFVPLTRAQIAMLSNR
jgi:ABC-type amino acid transport substrate-binding protein